MRKQNRFLIPILSLSILLTSCASIFNTRPSSIDIFTEPDSALVILPNGDHARTPLALEIQSKTDSIALTIQKDGIEESIILKQGFSNEFLYGNLLLMHLAPAGYLVDIITKDKKRAYSNSILIDLEDNGLTIKQLHNTQKGDIRIIASLPVFDFMEFDVNGRNYRTDRFFGFQLGLDYYTGDRTYLNIRGGINGVSEFFLLPMEELGGTRNTDLSSFSNQLSYNYDFLKNHTGNMNLSIGAGLSFTHYNYTLSTFNTSINGFEITESAIKNLVGLSFSAKLRLHENLFVGYNFLPSIYSFDAKQFEFSNFSYVELGMSIPLTKEREEPSRVLVYRR